MLKWRRKGSRVLFSPLSFDCRLEIVAFPTSQNGTYIRKLLPEHCASSIITLGNCPTASFSVLLDRKGDCRLVVGDMEAHQAITTDWVSTFQGHPVSQNNNFNKCTSFRLEITVCRKMHNFAFIIILGQLIYAECWPILQNIINQSTSIASSSV